jgi:hypothetical protein
MMKGVSQLKVVYKHFRKYRAQDGVGLVFIDFEGTQLPLPAASKVSSFYWIVRHGDLRRAHWLPGFAVIVME